ncbi:hypothetical protein [uncultured Subdoligranulum sp.]|uniref:hypothetical protein n=1 Tax=uncultured Subdoligranulum sp. TaxID=512298 RepID=UPI00320AB0AF
MAIACFQQHIGSIYQHTDTSNNNCGKGTPTPGVPSVSLYLDFDKKATAFFDAVYVLFAHFAVEEKELAEFVKSAGNFRLFAEKFERFAHLTKGLIRAVIGKTFQQPVQNSAAKWWKSGWECGFSTLSTEFSTMGKPVFLYKTYKGWYIVQSESGFALLAHSAGVKCKNGRKTRQKP